MSVVKIYWDEDGIAQVTTDSKTFYPTLDELFFHKEGSYHDDVFRNALNSSASGLLSSQDLREYLDLNELSIASTKEIRTVSSTGGEKGKKPVRMSLIPIDPLQAVAKVYNVGSIKYKDHNWRLGYDWSLSYDALMRHAQAFWNGEQYDPELSEMAGEPIEHLGSVIFHALALIEFANKEKYAQFDDRYKDDSQS